MALDGSDRGLLNLIQTDFPLVERPYAVLGSRLGLREDEVMGRIGRLKDAGLIREISAIFDSGRLGYSSVLVAMEVPPARLEEVGLAVSADPGVSHCYSRGHRFNLWYTLTVPPGESTDARATAIQSAVQVDRSIVLPALRRYKIGVNFDLTDDDEVPQSVRRAGVYPPPPNADTSPQPIRRAGPCAPPPNTDTRPGHAIADGPGKGPTAAVDDVARRGINPRPTTDILTDIERAAIRELQHDLPLEPQPFGAMAARLGISAGRLLQQAASLEERGFMRRYAAVLRHRAAGFTANGMSCWIVPPERVEEIGLAMAEWPAVTHCYERPVFPDWPYSLFGMIHSHTQRECLAEAAALSARIGIADYTVLFSDREFKKERVRYFV